MIALSKNYVLCIQLTDSHLFADTKATLLGIPTAESLNSVIELIKKEHTDIDLVVATGDISQDGSLESYQLFHDQTNTLCSSSLWLPGNHDEFIAINNHPQFNNHLIKQQNIGDFWRVITLNTAVNGKNYGELSTEELNGLRHSLQSHPERFHLICLHHPPFSCTNKWLNEIKLQNSWELFDCLEQHLNANIVLCGHIHQTFEICYRGTYLFSTPSTCIQFAPNSDDFKIDNLAPGYRWIKLFNDGSIDTGISRIENSPYQVNTAATEY